MARDDEIYELARKDWRIFFAAGHASRADAVRVLLADSWSARWEDRSDELRRRCGFVVVEDGKGTFFNSVTDFGPALKTTDAREAWRMLVTAPRLDPMFLGDVSTRLVEEPATIAEAIYLASAPKEMRAAEQLVRDAFARAAPFGVGPCPRIMWRAAVPDWRSAGDGVYDRSAFSPVHRPLIDAMGYAAWMSISRDGEKLFSSSSRVLDVPHGLSWTSKDMGKAMQFDEGRKRGIVAGDSPFELLLRIAYSGFLVEKVTQERVVLVATR